MKSMNISSLLESIIQNNSITAQDIALNLCITVIIGLFIFWAYQATYEGVMYSRNFNVTLVMITIVTAVIMMVIGSNLALSLGMVGALSIVRFRTAIKSPKDMAFIFWSISSGLAAGTGSFLIAIIGAIIIAITLFLLGAKGYDDQNYLIIIKGSNLNDEEILSSIKSYCKRIVLNMTTNEDEFDEIIYEARIKNDSRNSIIQTIKRNKDVRNITIISNKGQIMG